MNTRTSMALALIAITAAVVACRGNDRDTRSRGINEVELQVFKPVVFNAGAKDDTELYMVEDGPVDSQFLKEAAFVLGYYRIPFVWRDATLMVPRSSWKDLEMMANVTSKARDPVWLRDRQRRD